VKASLIFAAIAASVGYSDTGLADEDCRPVDSCHADYEKCVIASGETPAQCKLLYDASIKEHGVWGSTKARAASKTTGRTVFCHVDFE